MRLAFLSSTLLIALLVFGSVTGFIGYHYPMIIENAPLRNPEKIVRAEGNKIFLESGAVVVMDPPYDRILPRIKDQLPTEIQLERRTPVRVIIYALEKDGWICGTPWAQPIRIPLFPDTVYKNQIKLVGVGTYTESAK